MSLLEIDGSILEGGGQILRMALALSVITKTPVKIAKIREKRSKLGLREQHLKGVELLRTMCNAEVNNAKIGSTMIEFWPQDLMAGTYTSVMRTAGSVCLLAQVGLPCAFFAKSETTLRMQGGTNCEMAPQIEHTSDVLQNVLNRFGARFHCQVLKRGYFPKGGGEVVFTVPAVGALRPINLLDFGDVRSICGSCFVAGSLPIQMADEMALEAVNNLAHIEPVQIGTFKDSSNTTGDAAYGIVLTAETTTGCVLGASALGRKNEAPKNTAKRAAQELISSIKAEICVDDYVQDQIIIYMALAEGPSKVRVGDITLHTRTAIFVAEKFTNAAFEITRDGATNIIYCTGYRK